MKTMSITKIALALLVSIPALSLNGAAVATTVAPSLWKSFWSKTEALASRAMSRTVSGIKSVYGQGVTLARNNPRLALALGIGTITTTVALVTAKRLGINLNPFSKTVKSAEKILTPAEEFKALTTDRLKNQARQNELKQKKTQASKEQQKQSLEAAMEQGRIGAANIRNGNF